MRQHATQKEEELNTYKQAEEARRASEERFALAIAGSQVGTYDIHLPSGEMTCNEQWARTLGYDLAELATLNMNTVKTWVHPDDLARTDALLKQNLVNGALFFESEVRLRHKDGHWVWVHSRGAVVERDADGRALRMAGTHIDVTNRKRAEEALQKSKQEYHDIFENAVVGIFRSSPGGRFLNANATAARLLGYESPEELVSSITDMRTQIYANPEDRDEAIRLMREQGFMKAFEAQFRRKDGSIVWGSLSVRIVRDEKGQVLYYEGMSQDITERKRAEEALRESEERFRTFMENSPTIAWIKDEEGHYVYLSTTFEDRFGVRLDNWLGKADSEVWPLAIAEQFRRNDLEVLRSGQPIQVEEETIVSGGGRCSWWSSKFPFQDASGRKYVGGIGLDITERKKMHEDLRESRDLLELRVLERTAELERVNSQLRSIPSKLIAVQENERKRIAVELHDSVGQTLAALKYGIETVLVKKDSGDFAGAFELLERFVPTLQQSIKETRSIYMGLRPSMIDSLGLLATLEWFYREFQNLYSEFDLDVKTRIKEYEIPNILKITVFRIVQETLNNVAKHSKAKRVTVSFLKNRSFIELLVQDDGVGFDPESTLRDNPKALGLAGMKERVEAGSGRFSIESAPDKGSIIRAFWPM